MGRKVSANDPCPCGRESKYKKCCGLLHGGRPAPDPESLMRARYAAYAVADAKFLIASTHPDGPYFRSDAATWRRELKEYCRATEFVGLTVHAVEAPPNADVAYVTFTAALVVDGRATDLHERSSFRRDGGRWKYFAAEADA